MAEERQLRDLDIDRRQFLAGAVAAAALLRGTSASAAGTDWVAHVQERAANLDLGALILKALEVLGGPGKYRREAAEILAGVDLSNGFASVNVLEEDAKIVSRLGDLAERMGRDWRIKIRLLKLCRRAPQTAEAREALRQHLVTDWLGVDWDGLRGAVDALPDERLAVVFGPPTNHVELVGLLLSDLMVDFLSLVHGTKGRAVYCVGSAPTDDIVDVLVDPEIDIVAFQGHGHWSSFSLMGYYVEPAEVYERLATRAARSPRDFLVSLQGRLWDTVKPAPYGRSILDEADLGDLAAALGDSVQKKEMIVRHTCGTGRFEVSSRLLLRLIPDDLAEEVDVEGAAFSARLPEGAVDAEAALAAWLADTAATVEETPALGSSFVAKPEDTRGYDGLSWIHHFIADPIPAHRPSSLVVTPPEGDEPAKDAP